MRSFDVALARVEGAGRVLTRTRALCRNGRFVVLAETPTEGVEKVVDERASDVRPSVLRTGQTTVELEDGSTYEVRKEGGCPCGSRLNRVRLEDYLA